MDVSEIAVNKGEAVSPEEPELSELVQVVGRLPGPAHPGQPQYFRFPNYRVVFPHPARPQPILYPFLPRLTGYHPRLIAPRTSYFARNLLF